MTEHLKAKSLTNQIFVVGLLMDDYHCFQFKGTFYMVLRQYALTWPMCVCLACYKMRKALTFCNLRTRRTPPSDIGSLKKPQKYGIWPSDQIQPSFKFNITFNLENYENIYHFKLQKVNLSSSGWGRVQTMIVDSVTPFYHMLLSHS